MLNRQDCWGLSIGDCYRVEACELVTQTNLFGFNYKLEEADGELHKQIHRSHAVALNGLPARLTISTITATNPN